MNPPDDFENGLRDRLSSALRPEPPMTSLPHEDVARGRRLDRRRRWTTVGAAATVVPALTLGAYAVAGGFAGGTGPTTVRMDAAAGGGTDPSTPSDATLSADCGVAPPPGSGDTPMRRSGSGGKSLATRTGGSASLGSTGHLRVFGSTSGSGHLSAHAVPGGPMSAVGTSGSAEGDVTSCGTLSNGPPIDTPEIDRVTEALTRHVDPSGSHAGMTIAGGSVDGSADGGTPSGIYVGYEWTDGTGTGMVSLSVEDPSGGNGGSCADPSVVDGPNVTCETRTLDDGTTVLVGHGQQDGAERITVQYVRPDGTIVWATADAATEQWWTDHSATAPLSSPPATVDELISLAQDSQVRL
jgi:hypothetical protein